MSQLTSPVSLDLTQRPPFASVLRELRTQARLSQLALSSEAEISSRHLSFLETGRARPSREMVLHLGQVLNLPLAQRNRLLDAAGFATVYGQRDLNDPSMASARSVIDTYLASLEPNPAIVTDRCWNVLQRNRAAQALGSAAAMVPGVEHQEEDNLLLSTLDPASLRALIVNWRQVAGHLVLRLRRELALAPDTNRQVLLDRALQFPDVADLSIVDTLGETGPMLPVQLRIGEVQLSFITLLTSFGSPLDATLQELHIETYLPSDKATAALLAEWAGAST